MSDRDFIIFLCEQIWDIVSDGNEPNMDKICKELFIRNIEPDDIFIY